MTDVQLRALKTWVLNNDNRRATPTHDLDLVLHEMLVNDIGMRGGNVFTITYPLFASVSNLFHDY